MTRTRRAIEELRKGDAVIEVRDAAGRPRPGLPVWAEQEAHAFPFGCIVPDRDALPEPERSRRLARLSEVFNRTDPPARDAARLGVPDRVHLGVLRVFLDRLATADTPLDVHVTGATVGLADTDERDAARRLAELYTLCFAHPVVRGLYWNGVRDGEPGVAAGLLRRDCSPKPAFRALQKLIGVVWHTRAAGATDADGHFCFRGFFGDYRVGVRVGEETKVALFSLQPGDVPTRVPIPAAP